MDVVNFAADYSSSFGAGTVTLDDCNFHESVRLESFDIDRTLTMVSAIEVVGKMEKCDISGVFIFVRFNCTYHVSILTDTT